MKNIIFEYPIKETLGNVFRIIQGHQITDEEIYKSYGSIPVYTGAGELKGFWDKALVGKDDLPCLTYATKAFDGTIVIRNEIFDANNTAVLILKDKYKEIVLLEWISVILPKIFLEIMTSKEGVSYLNREIVEAIEINIPDRKTQEDLIIKHKAINERLDHAKELLRRCKALMNKFINIEYKTYQGKNVEIEECVGYMSGNSGLTEEFVYHTLQEEGKKYSILSSATEERTMMGTVPKCYINNKELKVFEGKEGLLVTRNGKAGQTRYLSEGTYTINDHAYILFVKPDSKYQINLKWLSIQYKSQFLMYSSNADNGTWNMTGFFKHTKIDIPNLQEQLSIVKKYEILERRIDSIENIKKHYSDLVSKEIA
ncbi:MAG: hypothetical protein E7566_05315 [Ruminococcaceae bacterium]|nr:hypothetical protein [Oscillospiraceae bacterium]